MLINYSTRDTTAQKVKETSFSTSVSKTFMQINFFNLSIFVRGLLLENSDDNGRRISSSDIKTCFHMPTTVYRSQTICVNT